MIGNKKKYFIAIIIIILTFFNFSNKNKVEIKWNFEKRYFIKELLNSIKIEKINNKKYYYVNDTKLYNMVDKIREFIKREYIYDYNKSNNKKYNNIYVAYGSLTTANTLVNTLTYMFDNKFDNKVSIINEILDDKYIKNSLSEIEKYITNKYISYYNKSFSNIESFLKIKDKNFLNRFLKKKNSLNIYYSCFSNFDMQGATSFEKNKTNILLSDITIYSAVFKEFFHLVYEVYSEYKNLDKKLDYFASWKMWEIFNKSKKSYAFYFSPSEFLAEYLSFKYLYVNKKDLIFYSIYRIHYPFSCAIDLYFRNNFFNKMDRVFDDSNSLLEYTEKFIKLYKDFFNNEIKSFYFHKYTFLETFKNKKNIDLVDGNMKKEDLLKNKYVKKFILNLKMKGYTTKVYDLYQTNINYGNLNNLINYKNVNEAIIFFTKRNFINWVETFLPIKYLVSKDFIKNLNKKWKSGLNIIKAYKLIQNNREIKILFFNYYGMIFLITDDFNNLKHFYRYMNKNIDFKYIKSRVEINPRY